MWILIINTNIIKIDVRKLDELIKISSFIANRSNSFKLKYNLYILIMINVFYFPAS